MKKTATATVSPPPPKSSPPPGQWSAFFKDAYLALLSSAFPQVEVRDRDGELRILYTHPELEDLSRAEDASFDQDNHRLHGEARHAALTATMRRSGKIQQELLAADEEARLHVLVDRCYRMAVIATDRYFEERALGNFNSEL